MGGIEDNRWVDMMIDKIGFALTKVDESIQKSIELWKELTKDIYDEQPTHDTTGQPNNGKSGEEDYSQDKFVAEVKERPIQHWAMRLGEAKESQHWAMCDSKILESLIQEEGDDEVEEKEKEDDEGIVSESSGEEEDMCELTLGNSATRHRRNPHHYHNEEAIYSTGLSFKWNDGYEQLNDDDKSWGDDYDDCENLWKSYPRVPLGSCYLPPMHPLHKENNALYLKRRNPYHMSTNDDESSKKDDESWEEEEEDNLETLETNYRHNPSGYHHRNEEDTDSRICYELLQGAGSRARDGYEMLKNGDTSSEDGDEDSWDGEEDVAEYWSRKYRVMSDATNISLVDDDDEDDIIDDDLSDKLQGFVDVKKEEIEVETFSPECDWVYVTRD